MLSGSHTGHEGPVLLRGVDAVAVDLPDGHGDLVAVFQGPKLFELFGLLQRTRGQGDVLGEEAAAVGVEADVLERRGRGVATLVAVEWDEGSRKVERGAVGPANDLHYRRIGGVLAGGKWRGDGRNDHPGVGCRTKRLNGSLDQSGLEFRFVALHVDDNVVALKSEDRRGLMEARCAVGVIGAGHHRFAAEGLDGVLDALVVAGDDDAVNSARTARGFVDVLDQRLAGFGGEDFLGESRGCEPSRDDRDDAFGWHRSRARAAEFLDEGLELLAAFADVAEVDLLDGDAGRELEGFFGGLEIAALGGTLHEGDHEVVPE